VSAHTALATLVEAASGYYRGAGRFAWHFARGKLRGDPIYAALLAQGLLGNSARVLDLGCGQGLLAAWLLSAAALHQRKLGGIWPANWPPPPSLGSYLGIETEPREAARARAAFADAPSIRIVHGDIRDVDYPAADAVVILDVLHYIDYRSQETVLEHVRAALAPQGKLLLRVGDAAGGMAFAVTQAVDATVALLRLRRWMRFATRPLSEWRELLSRYGLRAQVLPMSQGTPFANFLLVAEPA